VSAPSRPISSEETQQRPPQGEDQVPPAVSRDELRQRAAAGISIVASRGVIILLLGFAGSVVVAHLLTPHDFGVVAIGMSVVMFTSMLADGGLGAALIRRTEPPTAAEYGALLGLQLTVTCAITLLAAAIGAVVGTIGLVTAVMVSSMPLVAFQFPGRIDFERSLNYRPLAVVEIIQVVTYQASAILLVVAGLGVWGLALATVIMRAVAAIAMCWVSPLGVIRPRFSWHRIRPLLGFGISFQAASATWLVRDQGLNASIAAIASVATLGLWSLARRLMEVPLVLFQTLWRVSFPTMSQLLATDEDVAPLIQRAERIAIIGSGLLLVGFAGSAPGLIPGVFGERWRDASSAIPWACLGLGIGGSVSVATVGYLYAVGDASAVLRSGLMQSVAWFAVTLPLLPVVGVAAVGLGWLASSLVEARVLMRATGKRMQTHLVGPLIVPVAAGTVSAALGYALAEEGGADFWSGIAGGVCSVATFLLLLLALHRTPLLETVRFVLRSLRAGASRDKHAGAPAGV
jgi:O-antigen/teichoic acid export membrane protein